MDARAIYRKTDKGRDEMARRSYGLPARVRSLLILVDGRRSLRELIEQGRHFGDAEGFLRQLVEGGFVEPVPQSAAASDATSADPGPVETGGSAMWD
ncbi:MAG: hypothetical protein OHK0026_13360 [Rhodocyclaceae bacterium]